MRNMSKKNKGITLIALVVTIVVLLILAATSIAMLTGDDGIITNAQNSKISTELSEYKEQLELYISNRKLENMKFDKETLFAGKDTLRYNTQKEGETGTIKTICPEMKSNYVEKIQIKKGKIILDTKNKREIKIAQSLGIEVNPVEKIQIKKGKIILDTKNKREIKIAQSLGIEVNPYEIKDGELVASDGNLLLVDNSGTLKIPESVTKIGEGAFSNTSLDGIPLKKIIIPSTVKEIGANAFAHNSTLEEVEIEDGVEMVGAEAFKECIALKKITFPDSVIEIGGKCMSWCKSLASIKFPKNLSTIKSAILSGCTSLKAIEIPEKVTYIGDYAFSNCTEVKEINIPASVMRNC